MFGFKGKNTKETIDTSDNIENEDMKDLEIDNSKGIKKKKKKKKKKDKDKDKLIKTDKKEKVETVFEKNNKGFKELVANDYVDFSESHKYGLIGEKYMKNMYIGITPSMVNFASFLHDLYTHQDIETSIFINPIDSEEAKSDLSKVRTNLEVELHTAGGSVNRADDMYAKVMEAKRLRDEVRDGYNKIYEVSIQSTLYANSLRELDNSAAKIRSSLARRDIGIKSATYVQEDCYLSNKPLVDNKLGEWHTFDKRSLACVFPFTSNNINHPNGVPIGFNKDNGLPVIYDTFHSKLDNYNMVIFAKSGGGKSTFIKMLAARSSTFDDIINIAIDIEPEYRVICETLGGINITIGQGSDTIINPFDVKEEEVKNKITGRLVKTVNIADKINSVTSVILTMAKGFTNSNAEYYNDVTRSIIRDCISECYEDKGIDDVVENLYENVEQKIVGDKLVGGRSKKQMPTLSDWYAKLKEKEKRNDKKTYIKYYDYLIMIMKEYCKSENGGFTCFDGQSTVELTYDIPFINFDVASLNESTELPLAQHIICDFIWETMVKVNDKGHKIRVMIDEAWRMAKIVNGQPKFPEALEFLDTMFRRARKKNTSTVIISQQFHEFYNEQTQSIIKNADTKMFLPPDETSIDDIQEVFKLTDGETYYLRQLKRGEGLLKCSTVSAKLEIDIPPFELDFVQTNQNASNFNKG